MLLTFDFKTVEEAQEFLAGLIAKPKPVGALPALETLAAKSAEDSTPGAVILCDENGNEDKTVLFTYHRDADGFVNTTSAPEKKKRGPKSKISEPIKVVECGIEDCRAALSALFDAKGRDAAKAALAEFKVARIGELKTDQYRGFIVTCETLSQPE